MNDRIKGTLDRLMRDYESAVLHMSDCQISQKVSVLPAGADDERIRRNMDYKEAESKLLKRSAEARLEGFIEGLLTVALFREDSPR